MAQSRDESLGVPRTLSVNFISLATNAKLAAIVVRPTGGVQSRLSRKSDPNALGLLGRRRSALNLLNHRN